MASDTLIGSTLDNFRITAKLGEGGMGEVYRAEDLKLGREVAIKVLPEAFVADPERLGRFEREAKVLASLNHPHIAGIHEVGEAKPRSADAVDPVDAVEAGDDTDGSPGPRPGRAVPAAGASLHYLVMELAPGETLAERIARGPIPVEEAVAIALQIARGLEAAHERGVVHRDLKPGNVMVDEKGGVKILDFGLAKALEPEPSSEAAVEVAHSPTLTYQATVAGALLGTAAYMSPEQARGEEADRRADVWALGVVVWEMLTGRKLFEGRTVSDTLAGILRDEIDVGELPSTSPPALRRLLRRCLERDPDRRLHDVADARIELEDLASGEDEGPRIPAPGTTTQLPTWRRWLPTALGATLLVLAAVVVWTALEPEQEGSGLRLRRFTVPMPNLRLLQASGEEHLALSPDGQTLVTRGYVGAEDVFYLRRLDEPEAVPLQDMGFTGSAFFSPSGRWLGFRTNLVISKLDLQGGGVAPIARTAETLVGTETWSPNGFLYGETRGGEILRIPVAGGEPETFAKPDPGAGEVKLRRPAALPSGRTLLLEVEYDDGRPPMIQALDLESGKRRDLGLAGTDPLYSTTGHLLYAQGGQVLVVPLDGETLEVTGPATALTADIWIPRGTMQLAVSNEGTMAYLSADSASSAEPVLISRSGEVRSLLADTEELRGATDPRFSPDGTRVVFQTEAGLSILDLRSNTVTKLVDEGFYPVWSPDGETILHGITSSSSYDLVRTYSDLRDKSEVFMDIDNNLRTAEWTEHGFIYREEIPGKGMDLKLLPADLEGEPLPLLDDEADELAPTISPDGRWLAFQSDRSGRDEVYITTFPKAGGHVQISTRGGGSPAWSPDGDELFYLESETLVAARLAFDPRPRVVDRTPLFSGSYHQYRWYRQYDVHPDGEHFLMLSSNEREGFVEIVLDWAAEVEPASR